MTIAILAEYDVSILPNSTIDRYDNEIRDGATRDYIVRNKVNLTSLRSQFRL